MKSKAFNLFYDLSHSLLLSKVENTNYYKDLKKRLGIFTSQEKRAMLIKQKIDYIFLNFDIAGYEVIVEEKINKIRLSKDKKVYFPYEKEEINFFDAIFMAAEIITSDFLNKKKNYDSEFASIYFMILKKVYKIDNEIIDEFYIRSGIKKKSVNVIYDNFVNLHAWSEIVSKHNFKVSDGVEDNSNSDFKRYIFNNNEYEIIVCYLKHKKIKAFELVKN